LKVQHFNIISCNPVYGQRKGKYASKEEESGEKERISMERRLKAVISRNHEK